MELHGKELPIHPYLICAIGAATGWLAGLLMGSTGKIVRIEEVLVGVFGAFIGGDFLMSQINGPTAVPTLFSAAALGMAIAGAGVMLVLLRMMRGVVGPLRNSKSRQRQR